MGTVIVVGLIGIATIFAVRSIHKQKKEGKFSGCGGNCNHCGGCR